MARTIHAVAQEIFLPLCVGGGIKDEAHADAAIEAGADKVSLNTAAIARPELLTALAQRYGSQAVIVAIDAKREGGAFRIYVRSGQQATERDADRVGARGGRPRRRRDPADVHRPRRDEERLRLRADRGGLRGGLHPGHRLGRRRHLRSLRRRVHGGQSGRGARGFDLPLRRARGGGPEAASPRPAHPGADGPLGAVRRRVAHVRGPAPGGRERC